MKNIDEFLALLKNVKRSGTGKWMACCPAHNDGQHKGEQSLSVGQKEYKILIKCFAGCQTPDIVKTLGLTMSDLFIGEKKEPPGRRARGNRRKSSRSILIITPETSSFLKWSDMSQSPSRSAGSTAAAGISTILKALSGKSIGCPRFWRL